MENFETIVTATEKSLDSIRGIFDKEDVERKIKELEQISLNENFWKNKDLVKKQLNKKKFLKIFLIHIKNPYKI